MSIDPLAGANLPSGSAIPLLLRRDYGSGLAPPSAPTGPTVPAAPPPIPKLEPQWRAGHRLQSGLKLTIVMVVLGLLLAAVVGVAAKTAVVFLNDSTVSQSSTNGP